MPFGENSTSFGGRIFVRIAVGLIFFTQGILKCIDPKMGVERFARIGFPRSGAYRAFRGDIRDCVRTAGSRWIADSYRGNFYSRHHLHGNRDHKDP
jgi:hypothetical protein